MKEFLLQLAATAVVAVVIGAATTIGEELAGRLIPWPEPEPEPRKPRRKKKTP
jgi:hypothetical protein